MIAIIDYGMGNLRSVQKALERSGAEAVITQDPNLLKKAQKVVLPGVGAIKPAMEKLVSLHLVDSIKEVIQSGKPFLGICLGFQLLFEKSLEGGHVNGLGVFPGSVEPFTSLKVPHMGWNELQFSNNACQLWKGLNNASYAYFCHSYYVKPKDAKLTAAKTSYGIDFASAIARDNVFAVQFHPEKSQEVGLKILKNFTGIRS